MSSEPSTDAQPSTPDLDAIYEEIQLFRAGFSTLSMASISPGGEPEASYAPYLEADGDLYIFVSALSVHTANLIETGRVSVLFIEDEATAAHPFVRRRLTLQCRVDEIARDSDGYEAILDRFETRFGGLVATLRALADFHLLRLRPERGRYVKGFGKAFAIDDVGLARVRHIRENGSRAVPGEDTAV
ncbi:HugZ family pyridoxamine 5'-phosphate oxidase [Thiocapsa marina]|uniref:Pyridoxamine 5'-phosphate oxidase-related FMN-binding protein n=1 Tax=Thiocapsa marina 5811 TaxID=768671 RepID=F9U6P5_9GAMM|nr:pyridoxamine 5'-phosphate oxidase family protein [Thiocapsa marina]EGV19921.1 pyridoxamine 5'-phosphate oxidase-related FMN-binding protein [Thiocapsa marina 5811]